MHDKIKYLWDYKKILIILLGVATGVILFYGTTYNMPVLFGLDSNSVNFFLETLVNLSCGFIISLIFYIIVVFNPEFNKSKHISERILVHFARINTFLGLFIHELMNCYDVRSIEAWTKFMEENNGDIVQYRKLFRKMDDVTRYEDYVKDKDTYYDVLNHFVSEINMNLSKLDLYITYLNEDALSIYSALNNTYIFESFDLLKNDFKTFPVLSFLERANTEKTKVAKLIKKYERLYNC